MQNLNVLSIILFKFDPFFTNIRGAQAQPIIEGTQHNIGGGVGPSQRDIKLRPWLPLIGYRGGGSGSGVAE